MSDLLMFDGFQEPWQWLYFDGGRVLVIAWRKTPWMMKHERGNRWADLRPRGWRSRAQ